MLSRDNLCCVNSEYVDLDLQSNDGDNCFTVKPEELLLRTGEEQEVVVTFHARSNRKYKEWYVSDFLCFNYMTKCMTEFPIFICIVCLCPLSLLTILVLPSGPQYEVVLKGEVVQGNSGNVTCAQVLAPHGEVPPILSNKQFMAWGGVTLGRAV